MHFIIAIIFIFVILIIIRYLSFPNEKKPFVEKLEKPFVNNNNNNKIPKIIHQTFSTRDLNVNLTKIVNKWKKLNTDYEYKFYDDNDCRNFIKDNFEERILNAYDKIIPGAYKADVWRYCVLYLHGGIYNDIKMNPSFPINYFVKDEDIVLIRDSSPENIYQAFIAVKPGNEFIWKCIETSIFNIENNYYGKICLDITGPGMVGKEFLKHYNVKNISLGVSMKMKDEKVTIYNFTGRNKITFFKENFLIVNEKDEKILNPYYKEYYDDLKSYKIKRYANLYNKRKIYKI